MIIAQSILEALDSNASNMMQTAINFVCCVQLSAVLRCIAIRSRLCAGSSVVPRLQSDFTLDQSL